jgi:hypothetical protein
MLSNPSRTPRDPLAVLFNTALTIMFVMGGVAAVVGKGLPPMGASPASASTPTESMVSLAALPPPCTKRFNVPQCQDAALSEQGPRQTPPAMALDPGTENGRDEEHDSERDRDADRRETWWERWSARGGAEDRRRECHLDDRDSGCKERDRNDGRRDD